MIHSKGLAVEVCGELRLAGSGRQVDARLPRRSIPLKTSATVDCAPKGVTMRCVFIVVLPY